MRPLLLVLMGAVLGLTPSVLASQMMPARVVRRGEAMTFELSDGEPISYFLEHARQLGLTEEQKLSLMGIRRRLRLINAPFVRQLDSVREAVGLSLEPRLHFQDSDRQALERFQQQSRPIVDSIRVNNQAAQGEARLLLTSEQAARLEDLVRMQRDSTSGRGRRPPPR